MTSLEPSIITDHQRWFDAIRNDDVDELKDIVSSSSTDVDEQRRLVDGRFIRVGFDDVERRLLRPKFFALTRPLTVAAAHGAVAVLEVLVGEYGVDVFAVEAGGYNVVHCLVGAAFYQPEVERCTASMYDQLCAC